MDQNPSDVARLSRAIKTNDDRDKTSPAIPQIVYYHPGLGTEIGPFKSLRNLFAGVFGWGIVEHIKDVYSFISYNFEIGDELFFFGFSRGAYLVRAVSGFIADFGILKKPGMSEFVDVFKLYTERPFNENTELQETQSSLIEHNTLIAPGLVTVKVIGCFDTVGALGIPRVVPFQSHRYEFLNLSLSSNVEHAFHALSLDENRKPFEPTLWFFTSNHDPQKFKQVWFNGTHVNIGGGDMTYTVKGSNLLKSRDDSPNVLSDGTLIWMVSECEDLLSFDTVYLHIDIMAGHTQRDGKMNYAGSDDRRANQPVPVERTTGRQPIWYLGPICNNYGGIMGKLYLLLGKKSRTVNKYVNQKKDTSKGFFKRVITGDFRRITTFEGDYVTNESVHESVAYRMLKSGKTSCPLVGLQLVDSSEPLTDTEISILPFNGFEKTFWGEERQDILDPIHFTEVVETQ
ncbi:hypothetical protein V1522DRAFT_399062 [Lipomyces starkeyi]